MVVGSWLFAEVAVEWHAEVEGFCKGVFSVGECTEKSLGMTEHWLYGWAVVCGIWLKKENRDFFFRGIIECF